MFAPHRAVTGSLELAGIAWSDVDVQIRDGGDVWWATVIDADDVPGSSPVLDAMLLHAIPATYNADIALTAALLTFEGQMGEPTAQFRGQVSATGSVRDGTESIQGTLSRVPYSGWMRRGPDVRASGHPTPSAGQAWLRGRPARRSGSGSR